MSGNASVRKALIGLVDTFYTEQSDYKTGALKRVLIDRDAEDADALRALGYAEAVLDLTAAGEQS